MDRACVGTSLVALLREPDRFVHVAMQHPGRLLGLAYFDSRLPGRGVEQVRRLCDDHAGLVVGVTTGFACHGQDPRLEEFAPLYAFCAQRGLPVQIHVGGAGPGRDRGLARPVALGVLATHYPGLKIVGILAGDSAAEMAGLLRRFPNLYLQVGSAPEIPGGFPPAFLRSVLACCGSRKVMFGSGRWGGDRGYCERVETLRGLPRWERGGISWRTAARVYGGWAQGIRGG